MRQGVKYVHTVVGKGKMRESTYVHVLANTNAY